MNRNKIMNMAPPTMVVTRSVQLGQRCIRVFAQPGLEEPGESERQRLARLGTGQHAACAGRQLAHIVVGDDAP